MTNIWELSVIMKKSLGLFQHNHKTVKRRTAVKRKKNDYNDRRYKSDEYEDDDIEDDAKTYLKI